MPRQKAIVAENKFIGGLKTEFTGLNFPEDACIDTYDCVFHRTSKVDRRLGLDYELNNTTSAVNRTNLAVSSYWWRNASGDGAVSLYVVQIGTILYFYNSGAASIAQPLSTKKLVTTITLTDFDTMTFDATTECQYADGNKHLFVFHPNMDPIVVTYAAGAVSATAVTVRIRDITGIDETGIEDNYRPLTLTDIHRYNLANQGWNKAWKGTSTTSLVVGTGTKVFTTQAGLPILPGDRVNAYSSSSVGPSAINMIGSVVSYTGTTLTVNVTSIAGAGTIATWTIVPQPALIDTWKEQVGNYPSNSDVWWYFKDVDDVFNPADTIDNVSAAAGPSPKGAFILDAFNQDRSLVSGITGLSTVTTGGVRPSTGTWFQSRVWYSGVNYPGFNEKLYFSQIIEKDDQFGKCYEVNDPTSQDRFDLLPSDGGEVTIQGTGQIYKLFTVINGLLVFAAKGIWFITGNTGIGFTANDFTITKISSIETLSHSSFVDVMGNPVWWNQEGIYTVVPQQGAFAVTSMTNTTIASFYQDIPLVSKYYAKGFYNPITFQIQWLYRSTAETNVTTRYSYSRILNFDTQINAFYPWKIDNSTTTTVNGIVVLGGNGLQSTLPQTFKYLTSTLVGGPTYNITFSEIRDSNYVDWETPQVGADYQSYFISGYKVHSQGMKKQQLPYINVYTEGELSELYLQARWDFTTSGDTGRWSQTQYVIFDEEDRAYQTKRLRLRGEGRAVQLKFASVSGKPMSLVGWSTLEESTQVP